MRFLFTTESPQSFEHYSCANASLSVRSTLYDVVKSGGFLPVKIKLKSKGQKGRQDGSSNFKSGLCKPELDSES